MDKNDATYGVKQTDYSYLHTLDRFPINSQSVGLEINLEKAKLCIIIENRLLIWSTIPTKTDL